MTQYIPISLRGNSLGERHRYLNTLVNEAYKSSVPFDSIQDLPEETPVDRLFKINLASKYKNVNYVIRNLRDSDMLYASSALKCVWLLEAEYANIVNAQYLGDELFPEMTEKARNKMQHWLQRHIRDPARCRDFYKYYKESEFETAVPFLWHCSNEYILEEFYNIIDRIKPKHLKVLSEKCPQLTKVFYEHLESDNTVLKHYLENEIEFFSNLKFVLKSDPETFFNVTEKYFNIQKFRFFRSDITRYVMSNHRKRFINKPELYTVWLLDMKALAESLSPEEVKDLVTKLAKAEYLEHWFTYQSVEPLIKRLNKEERVTFKKLIFVDKALEYKIKAWPYTPPAPPVLKKDPGFSIFQDNHRNYWIPMGVPKKRMIARRCLKGGKMLKTPFMIQTVKTLLDDLFEKYRFASFENTFFELRKRLKTESIPKNRQFIMLVLVSKCGGREKSLKILFELLSQYRNEPVNLRAAIIRSLVKRAFVWRLPADLWNSLLAWGHGLGLDGSPPEAACDEGLHAVVLRDLLAERTPNPTVLASFFNLYTDFSEYSLTSGERTCLRTRLPSLLLAAADSVTGHEKRQRLDQLLVTLAAYKIPYSQYPGILTAITASAQEDPKESNYLLQRLYTAHVGRKQLFKENFHRIQNSASYVNALRHDMSILNAKDFKEILEKHERRLRFEHFFRKLIIYFSESGGLAEQYYGVLTLFAKSKPKKFLACSMAILAGNDLTALLKTFDNESKERRPKTPKQSLAAALRANAHVSRPPLDVNLFGWQAAGAKAVANSVSKSPKGKLEEIVNKLMTWKRTLHLALALTKSEDTKCAIYKTLAALRPGSALKVFLRYLENEQHGSGFHTIWNVVKSLITEINYRKRERLRENLENVKSVPSAIKAEFYLLVYKAFLKINRKKTFPILHHIRDICYQVDETFFYDIFQDFFKNSFIGGAVFLGSNDKHLSICCVYIDMIVKFLLLCKSDETQKRRLDVVGELLLSRIEQFWKKSVKVAVRFLDVLITSLKYNKVFFDSQYVSCKPVFERVVSWLHSILPIEMWFDRYIHIHLTMLYYKTARHCVLKKPELFTDDHANLIKGVEMFGVIFGKFVTHDYEELIAKYFQSIRQIYRTELLGYLCEYIDYRNYDESKELFAIAFLKSILEETEASEAHFVAAHLFRVHASQYFRYDYDKTGIERILRETKFNELRFCVEIEL